MADVWLGENLNRGRKLFDKSLELRDVADGAEASTAAETGIAFDCRKLKDYVCVVYVTAIDATTGDETYVLNVGVSDAVDGTYTPIATLPNIRATGTGLYVIPLNGEIAAKLDADSDFIQIAATLGGTSPSITYGAFLAPC